MGDAVETADMPTPLPVPAGSNAADDVWRNAAEHPRHVAFSERAPAGWRPVTCADFARRAAAVAAGLIAAGIEPTERVALLSRTRLEWPLCDTAIMTAGAVTVPIYDTSSAQQIEWILRDSGAVAAFVENAEQAALVRERGGPPLRHVWTIASADLDELTAGGTPLQWEDLSARCAAVTPDAIATIVYTSGTTGRPKGCMLSHANLRAEVLNVSRAEGVSELVLHERSSMLMFLPLAHIFARAVQLAAIHNRTRVGYLPDPAGLPGALASFRPTVLVAVPRVFEKAHDAAMQAAARSSARARLFRLARDAAVAYSRACDPARERPRPGPGLGLRARYALFGPLVYARVRRAFGGRLEYAVSGGAALDPTLGHFFRGAGITVLEGWGMTETTAGATLNLPAAQRVGTAGRALPGTELRIAGDGEIQVRGATVFTGYWHDEQATARAFDDGWLHTGDLGALDQDGFLTVTGRRKDLIVTSSGKNVAPGPLEDEVRLNPLVAECVVVGDARPYVAALITLDPDGFAQWKRRHQRPPEATAADLREDEDLRAAVGRAVAAANRSVSHAEAIKRFAILPDALSADQEITPTLKVRRAVVIEHYTDEIRHLYE